MSNTSYLINGTEAAKTDLMAFFNPKNHRKHEPDDAPLDLDVTEPVGSHLFVARSAIVFEEGGDGTGLPAGQAVAKPDLDELARLLDAAQTDDAAINALNDPRFEPIIAELGFFAERGYLSTRPPSGAPDLIPDPDSQLVLKFLLARVFAPEARRKWESEGRFLRGQWSVCLAGQFWFDLIDAGNVPCLRCASACVADFNHVRIISILPPARGTKCLITLKISVIRKLILAMREFVATGKPAPWGDA
jgi:hypothetical protein